MGTRALALCCVVARKSMRGHPLCVWAVSRCPCKRSSAVRWSGLPLCRSVSGLPLCRRVSGPQYIHARTTMRAHICPFVYSWLGFACVLFSIMEQVVAMDMDVLVIDEPYAPNKLFLGTIIHRAGCTFVVPVRRFRSTKSCAEYLAMITTRIAADSCPIGVYRCMYAQ